MKLSFDNKHIIDAKFFEFSIRNTGEIDVTSQMLRKPVEIDFSGKFKILDAKLKEKSDVIDENLEFDSNKLTISWDTLKPKESIKIQSLICFNNSAEYNQQEKMDFISSINIHHRIVGITNIGKFLSVEIETQGRTKSYYLIQAYIDLFFALLFFSSIPPIMHWILQLMNDFSYEYEWKTVDIVFSIFYFILTLFHLFATIFNFDTAKKFK
ncbi:hypothetical protein [Maribacter sp. R86514]|uniref:hypothetical protein n=1 Tax=Maribacter sp. R86514 TaxID=3093854 RepID=UPI0037C70299